MPGSAEPVAWHLITGEYPPVPGGVADYTYLVAGALAREVSGPVHVWTSPADGATPEQGGVVVHREMSSWDGASLARLSANLDACPGPRRLLVQYTTNAWGRRGMNLGFPRWLVGRKKAGDDVWAMLHEAMYMFRPPDKPSRLIRAAAHRLMLRSLLAACSRAFVSMSILEGRIRAYAPRSLPIECAPVPSNVPVVDDPEGVAALRGRYAPRGETIVGCFGTYGDWLRPMLRRVLPSLLAPEGRVGLLLGRNGADFARESAEGHPALQGKLIAPGGLAPGELSRHLQACDLMVQPYDVGVATKRGSLMACLSHGRAVATHLGKDSEPFWSDLDCLALGDDPGDGLIVVAERLIRDPAERDRLGRMARNAYEDRFALACTIKALLWP